MLAAFVGCAGVGKNTVIKELIDQYPETYAIFPTLTTRDMRPGEVEGNPYHFVSKQRFNELIELGEIYEWQQIHDGNLYGGSREVLSRHLATGKTLIKDIDVLGAKTYKDKLSDITKILSVFLYVDDMNTLLNRMRARGDSEQDITKRAERFPMEMELSKGCDYMLSNDVLSDTAAEADCLLKNEQELNGLYRPVSGSIMPNEVEIALVEAEIDMGIEPESVELVFNGKELMLLNSIAAYIAAKRKNAFIQKKIRTLCNPDLKPMDVSLSEWERLLG